jgi:DnaD/phage-associated family protein
MRVFSGFPVGKVSYTSLPNLLFSELLPLIDDLAERKVTLHAFWLIRGKKGSVRSVSFQELLGDGTLMGGLKGLASSPEEALREGLERAVARGTLLHVVVSGEKKGHWYFVNGAEGRRAVQMVQLGETTLGQRGALVEPAGSSERLGLLQPIIAEELQDAESTYPPQWIEDAFRIAVENNVRKWKYVRRILERWASEGKDDDGGKRRGKPWYSDEEYARYIKH